MTPIRTHAFLLSPTPVFRARMNYGTGLPDYPVAEVAYDTVTLGADSDVLAGMTVTFGTASGADDLGRQRIRKAADGTFIFIGNSSEGIFDGQVTLQDNAYITVWDDYRVWAKLPRIDRSGSTAILYKDYDIDASGLVEYQRPVANVGSGGYAATIDSGSSLITHEFDGSGSYQFDSGGTTITGVVSYSWDVDDGTITVGVSTDATITATFPPGFRWVKLTVEADSGKTHTRQIPVFARDPDADVCIAHQVTSYHVTAQGQEVSLRILQDLPRATYPDGTLLMLWADGDPAGLIHFIGWHQSDDSNVQAGRTATLRDSTLHFVDVAGRLKRLPGMSQIVRSTSITVTADQTIAPGATALPVLAIERVIPSGTTLAFNLGHSVTLSSTAGIGAISLTISAAAASITFGETAVYTLATPVRWDETNTPNFLYYAWYLLAWHSTALELGGLFPSQFYPDILPSLQFHELGSDEGDLYTQVESIVSLVDPDHHLSCTRSGNLLIELDPNMLVDADRTVYVVGTYTPTHWNQLTFSDERTPRVYRLTAYAIVSTPALDTAKKCIAPNSAEGQGGQSLELTNRYTDDQYTLNYVEGNRYAKANSRYGPWRATMPIDNVGSEINPARRQFMELTADSAPRPFPTEFARALVTEAEYNFDYAPTGTTVTATLTFEAETIGPAAATVTAENGFV